MAGRGAGWQGVTYGVSDPLVRAAILASTSRSFPSGAPLTVSSSCWSCWRSTGVAVLYMLVGAIRWIERRPAINDHARSHLGWLLAALALALAWGYLLEPYELVAGPAQLVDSAIWRSSELVSPVLAGIALAAGGMSAVWASRPRHALAFSAWIVLAASSMMGHWLLPAMLGGSGEPAVSSASLQHLSRIAYGLGVLQDTRLAMAGPPAPPAVPALWNSVALAQTFPGDSSHVVAMNPAVLTPGGKRRPVWLVLRSAEPGRVIANAVADHRVSPAGEPLFFRLGDTLPRLMPTPLLDLRSDVLGPEAREYRIRQADGPGVLVGSWPRRLALAWALQAGELLSEVPPGTRIDWRLSPEERVGRLVPFAEWSAPTARVIDGELVWLLDGFVTSSTFPLTSRAQWRNRRVGAVAASFLGTVDAENGTVRVYLQPGADPVAAGWSRLAEGVVEPAAAIPDGVQRAMGYPADLFRIQAQQLERTPWNAGTVTGSSGGSAAEQQSAQVAWAPDTSGALLVSTFEVPSERRLSAVLLGSRDEGRTHLSLIRLDSATTLPVRDILQDRWANFPSYDALSDSIREDGGKLERGPLRVEVTSGGPVAYQGYFALRPSGGTVLAWVSVAAPNRLGAGRTLKEAWSNLLGATVPAPPGTAQSGRLDEARRWVERADSALRSGDWSEFGRAWNSLRNVLGIPTDSVRF